MVSLKQMETEMDKVIEILEAMVKSSNTSGSELKYVLSEIKKEKMKTCISCKYGHLDLSKYLSVHKCDLGCNSIDFDFCCNRHKYKEKKQIIKEVKK